MGMLFFLIATLRMLNPPISAGESRLKTVGYKLNWPSVWILVFLL